MARSRNIKPQFFQNEDLVELRYEVRLLFIGLWTLADREGRLEDRPKRIKMNLFPADEIDVEAAISELGANGFVRRYEVENIKVIQIVNFSKHQKPHHQEAKSSLPPEPSSHEGASPPPRSRSDSLNTDSLNTDSLNTECADSAANDTKNSKVQDRHNVVAVRLSNPVKARFPKQHIDLDRWATEIEKIERIDKYPLENLCTLWMWIQNHGDSNFSWADQIRTPAKLRARDKQDLKYLDKLTDQMNREVSSTVTNHNIREMQKFLDSEGEDDEP